MKNILIEGKEYYVKTAFSDLLAKEYFKLNNVLNKAVKEEYTEEEKHLLNTLSTEASRRATIEATIYTNEQKMIDVIRCVSNVPKKLLKGYPELLEIITKIIVENISTLMAVEEKEREYYVIGKKRYYPSLSIHQWSFQEWCDIDGLTQGVHKMTKLGFVYNEIGILVGCLRLKNKPYDRFMSDFNMLYSELSKMPAVEVVGTLQRLLSNMQEVKDTFDFVYGQFDGEPAKAAMAEHMSRVKWEDTIALLAETPVFNGPRGTLEAIRTENALVVLDYLNTKRSRENAEYQDYKRSQEKGGQVNI